jgi:4'-phosphopantetheinyl transferase
MTVDVRAAQPYRSRTSFALKPGVVDWMVLSLSPEAVGMEVAAFTACVSPKERAKAGRMRTQMLRDRRLLAYAFRRHVLSDYTAVPPEAVAYLLGEHGKPVLDASVHGDHAVCFNFSDSDRSAVLAVGTQALGVDIECPGRRTLDWLGVARRFFAPEEYAYLCGLPEEAQQACFFMLWTGKEAMLKAAGLGLSHALNKVVIRPEWPQVGSALCSVEPLLGQAEDWFLQFIDCDDKRVSALAVKGALSRVALWSWSR